MTVFISNQRSTYVWTTGCDRHITFYPLTYIWQRNSPVWADQHPDPLQETWTDWDRLTWRNTAPCCRNAHRSSSAASLLLRSGVSSHEAGCGLAPSPVLWTNLQLMGQWMNLMAPSNETRKRSTWFSYQVHPVSHFNVREKFKFLSAETCNPMNGDLRWLK